MQSQQKPAAIHWTTIAWKTLLATTALIGLAAISGLLFLLPNHWVAICTAPGLFVTLILATAAWADRASPPLKETTS